MAKSSADGGPVVDPFMVAVRHLGAALDRYDEAASRALGIGRSDLRALNLLEHGPLTAGEIGDRLDLTSGSVTALINRLETGGMVRRVKDGNDRRVVRVRLEDAVYASFARIYAPCGRAVASVSATLPPATRDAAVQAVVDAATAIERTRDALTDGAYELR